MANPVDNSFDTTFGGVYHVNRLLTLPHQVELAPHFITQFLHNVLSFIAFSSSSFEYSESFSIWLIYVIIGLPRFLTPWIGSQSSMSPANSSLFRQQ